MKDPKYKEALKKKVNAALKSLKDIRNSAVSLDNRLKRARDAPQSLRDDAGEVRSLMQHVEHFVSNLGNQNANEHNLKAAIKALQIECAAADITLFQIQIINAVRFSKWDDLKEAIDGDHSALQVANVKTSKRGVDMMVTDSLQEGLEKLAMPIKNKSQQKDDEIAAAIGSYSEMILSISKVPQDVMEELQLLHETLDPPNEGRDCKATFQNMYDAAKAPSYAGIYANLVNTPFFSYMRAKSLSYEASSDGSHVLMESAKDVLVELVSEVNGMHLKLQNNTWIEADTRSLQELTKDAFSAVLLGSGKSGDGEQLCKIIDGGLSFLNDAQSQAATFVSVHYQQMKSNDGESEHVGRWKKVNAAALNLGIDLIMQEDKEMQELVKANQEVKQSVDRFMEAVQDICNIDDVLTCMTSTFDKIHKSDLGGDETGALRAIGKLSQLVDKTTLMTDSACAEVILEIKAGVGNDRGRQHWESDYLKCIGITMQCIQNAVEREGEVALGAVETHSAEACKMKKHLFQGTCWFSSGDSTAKQEQLTVIYSMILPICEARSWMDKPDDLPKDSEALVKAANEASSANLSLISDESRRSSFREFAVKLARKLDEVSAKMASASLERLASVAASLKECLFGFVCFV